MERGDARGALEFARKAAAGAPNCGLAHHACGFALESIGRNREAAVAYAREIAVIGDDGAAYFNLGCVFAKLGKRAEAIDTYRKSIVADPKLFAPYVNLAGLLGDARNCDEALNLSRTAVALAPGNVMARLSLAQAFERCASRARAAEQRALLDSAVEEYWAIREIDKSNAAALRGLGGCYAALGQFDNAKEKLLEAYRIEPKDTHIRKLIALNYMMRLQVGNAIRAILGMI
jgi:tetratricopeptide (TPR) repeat protein